LKTSDFDYHLPEELIAQHPLKQRDASRLMVFDRSKNRITHKNFFDIIDYLNETDVLVINETRVIPARLFGRREGLKNPVEILLLKRKSNTDWEAITRPGKRLKPGAVVTFSDDLSAEIIEKGEGGVSLIRFSFEGVFEEILDRLGQMPLPPYITEKLEEKQRYNTVYAKQDGSAAAPTAGLHFTPELMDKIRKKGVTIVSVILHVGLGTFRPVKAEYIEDHMMHSEPYEVPKETAKIVNQAKAKGQRIIAVGTTSVRTLEAATNKGELKAGTGETTIFIYPGYTFKMVDGLITNFHLPKSSLLMLVAALMGRENALKAYETAVKKQYRFFSFGDAMLII